jgi:membrane protease YdiL (CAAX protease family)
MSRGYSIKKSDEKKDLFYLDLSILGLFLLGLVMGYSLYNSYKDTSSHWISDGTYINLSRILFGLGGYVLACFIDTRQSDKKVEIALANEKRRNRLIEQTAIAGALAMAVQIVSTLIWGKFQFQVSGMDVYAFYVLAALGEEAFFRGMLVCLTYVLLKTALNLNKWTLIIICTIVSSIVFGLAHREIYGDKLDIYIATFLTGAIFGFMTAYNKSLIPGLLAHLLVNILAAGSLVQTLH